MIDFLFIELVGYVRTLFEMGLVIVIITHLWISILSATYQLHVLKNIQISIGSYVHLVQACIYVIALQLFIGSNIYENLSVSIDKDSLFACTWLPIALLFQVKSDYYFRLGILIFIIGAVMYILDSDNLMTKGILIQGMYMMLGGALSALREIKRKTI